MCVLYVCVACVCMCVVCVCIMLCVFVFGAALQFELSEHLMNF